MLYKVISTTSLNTEQSVTSKNPDCLFASLYMVLNPKQTFSKENYRFNINRYQKRYEDLQKQKLKHSFLIPKTIQDELFITESQTLIYQKSQKSNIYNAFLKWHRSQTRDSYNYLLVFIKSHPVPSHAISVSKQGSNLYWAYEPEIDKVAVKNSEDTFLTLIKATISLYQSEALLKVVIAEYSPKRAIQNNNARTCILL